MEKIYWFCGSYRGYDGSYHERKGYVFANNEDEAENKVEEDTGCNNIYLEERNCIVLEKFD